MFRPISIRQAAWIRVSSPPRPKDQNCQTAGDGYQFLVFRRHMIQALKQLSSKAIVNGLVNRPSNDGGQFKIVVPGDPDHRWLYLKASGKAAAAGCTPSGLAQCITATMPPSASGVLALSATELQTLRQWILDGALGPP